MNRRDFGKAAGLVVAAMLTPLKGLIAQTRPVEEPIEEPIFVDEWADSAGSPYMGEGWIGGTSFVCSNHKDRPDPLLMSRKERRETMRRQILEDVTLSLEP